jgi:hypothetical protein
MTTITLPLPTRQDKADAELCWRIFQRWLVLCDALAPQGGTLKLGISSTGEMQSSNVFFSTFEPKGETGHENWCSPHARSSAGARSLKATDVPPSGPASATLTGVKTLPSSPAR